MLARRALAISPDKELTRLLRTALMAAGTVPDALDSIAALPEEVQADVCVVHLPDNDLTGLPRLGAALGETAWIVVVLGRSDLSATVEAMMKAERVAAVIVADHFEPRELAGTIARLLHGDIFGLEKVVPWGTRVHSVLVADYKEKALAISQISEFAAMVGVRRKYREALEQCADEMLMNALYDAPVGPDGKPLFAEISTRDRVALKLDQRVVVQYACDHQAFALSVRDAYGSFERATLLRYLHKCLHSEQQIDRKAGGAGLGLYLMANSASLILFNLLPGVATEVICVFDVTAPKLQLHQIGVFNEKVEASAAQSTASPALTAAQRTRAPMPPPSATPRALMLALGSSIVLLLAIIVLVAYPRFRTETGAIEVVTDPPGATIEIDGRQRGTSALPLRIEDLQADAGHRVIARLAGHDTAETLVEVAPGQTATVRLVLPVRDATVLIESDPPGATVSAAGRELGVAPLTVNTLAPGTDVELRLRLPGYRDAIHKLKVPPAGGSATLAVTMPLADKVATVHIASDPPGAAIRQNGERLAGLTTPVATHLIEAGRTHRFTLELAGYMPATIEVTARPGQQDVPVRATLVPGGQLVVTSNLPDLPARAFVSSTTACPPRRLPLDCPLENGGHTVEIKSADPFLHHRFDVKIRGDQVRRDLELGVARAPDGWSIEVAGKPHRAVALVVGKQSLELLAEDGDARRTVEVDIRPGATISIP